MSAAPTLRRQTIDQALDQGLDDLLALNWEEMEGDERLPLAVDWDQYRWLERKGMYVLLAALSGARLVGYNNFFVHSPLHHRLTKWAVNDELWLEPEARNGFAGIRMVLDAEPILLDLGAKAILYTTKVAGDLGSGHPRDSVGKLLGRLGYGPYEASLIKFLRD